MSTNLPSSDIRTFILTYHQCDLKIISVGIAWMTHEIIRNLCNSLRGFRDKCLKLLVTYLNQTNTVYCMEWCMRNLYNKAN